MSASSISFEDFRKQALAHGFDEVMERSWPADEIVPRHSHPFHVQALLIQGEMWLTVGAAPTRHLRPGERFELAAGVEHAERYGPEGACYWVARRHAAGTDGARA